MQSLLYTLLLDANRAVNELPVGQYDLNGVLPNILGMIVSLLKWVFYQLDGIKLYHSGNIAVSILDLYITVSALTILIDVIFVTFGASDPGDYTQ